MYLLFFSFTHSQLVYAGFVSFQKPLGYAFKDYNYLLSKKIRYQKMRKKRCLSPSPYPKSYSPTIPVQRPEKDSQSNPLEAPFGSPVPLDLERSLSLSPTVPSTYRRRSYEEYYSPQDPTQGSSSPEAHNTRSLFLDTQSTAVEPATVLTQSERSPAHSPDMMTYPALLENSRFSRAGSPLYVPTSFGECELTHVTSRIIYPIFLNTLDASLWKLFVSHLEG